VDINQVRCDQAWRTLQRSIAAQRTHAFALYATVQAFNPKPLISRCLCFTCARITPSPGQDAVDVARAHAATDPRVRGRVRYECALIEDMVSGTATAPAATASCGTTTTAGGSGCSEPLLSEAISLTAPFDVVCALEVVEHVSDPKLFLDCCARLTRNGGCVVVHPAPERPVAAEYDSTIDGGQEYR
jgi:hypothetical protein